MNSSLPHARHMIMDRSKLDTLLAGLPETEKQLLATVHELEEENLRATAQDLLVRAVESGAGPYTHLELSRRLITRSRLLAALQILDGIRSTSHLFAAASLFRALAYSRLKKQDDARAHLQRAADTMPPDEIQAWERHLFSQAKPPPLPYRLSDLTPSKPDAYYDFSASEATHLFDPEEKQYSTPGEATDPLVKNPTPQHPTPSSSVEEEPTYMINIPLSASLPVEEAAPDDPTYVGRSISLDEFDDSEESRDSTTGLRYRDPTLPGEADRAGEMPRYSTDPRYGGDDISATPDATDDISLEDDDSSLKLELDLPEPSRPMERYGSARQLTLFIKERTRTHISDVLQSPLRALMIATLTALIIFGGGLALIYSAIFNSHINQEIQRVEHAVNADLYSSHLAALRDLNSLADYEVIPISSVDAAIRSFISLVPLVGVSDQVEEMKLFVQARMSYRFEHPGTFTLEPSIKEGSNLLMATRVYHLLSYDEFSSATHLIDSGLANLDGHGFSTLAYGDALVATKDTIQIQIIVDNFPDDTPATAYIKAQMRLLINEDEGKVYLEEIAQDKNSDHPGTLLELASRASDYSAARDLIHDLRDSNHPHASRIERARAHLIRAHFYGSEQDPSSQLIELQRAAEAAPLHPATLRTLIDHLRSRGELLDARSHLARVPASENRHSYFDIALANIHLSIGDLDRAIERLATYEGHNIEATALQAIAHAKLNDLQRAKELVDTINEDNPTAIATKTWLHAARDNDEGASQAIESIDLDALSPYFHILVADAYRILANQAESESIRSKYLRDATKTLETLTHQDPESRLQTCLIALDRRDLDASDEACAAVDELDKSGRPSTFAALRWHLYHDRLDQARERLQDHVERAGPHGEVDLFTARINLLSGEFESARTVLDGLPSSLRRSPQHLVVEGQYALRTGRLARAQQQFTEAGKSSSLHLPEATLGMLEADLLREFLEEAEQSEENLEDLIRSLLRNGSFGPRAWALFASLRLQQNRMADARENINFADVSLNDLGSSDERLHLLTQHIAIQQVYRDPGHARIKTLLEEAAELTAEHWRHHLLAARWHHHQDELDEEALLDHLHGALSLAPNLCALWIDIDTLEMPELQNSLQDDHDRSTECMR